LLFYGFAACVVARLCDDNMASQMPQHFGVSPSNSPPNKDVIGLLESFKTMSTAHGIHHINHASGRNSSLNSTIINI